MLTSESKEIVEALRKARKMIDIECEDCGEISACSKGCMWFKLIEAMEPILTKAEKFEESDTNESLF